MTWHISSRLSVNIPKNTIVTFTNWQLVQLLSNIIIAISNISIISSSSSLPSSSPLSSPRLTSNWGELGTQIRGGGGGGENRERGVHVNSVSSRVNRDLWGILWKPSSEWNIDIGVSCFLYWVLDISLFLWWDLFSLMSSWFLPFHRSMPTLEVIECKNAA